MKRFSTLIKVILPIISCCLQFTSCGVIGSTVTKEKAFPKFYAENPKTVVIMPPINETNKVEAKEAVYTTLFVPLAERGFYVFSPLLCQELFESESAYDAEMYLDAPLTRFHNVLGADAALFTRIKKWEKTSLFNTIQVEIEYVLRSTITGETLFQKNADLVVDCRVSNSGSFLLDLVLNTVTTALTDNVIGANKANFFVLRLLPNGPYQLNNEADKQVQISTGDIVGTVKL